MTEQWDEFTKSLAEPLPRRESLRRLGAVFTAAVLSPLGLAAATERRRPPDPCKTFCKCRNKAQQNACLSACNACNGDTSRLCGGCGSYVCCSTACCGGTCTNLAADPNCGACGNNCGAQGLTCCNGYCADLDQDYYNCGACGFVCEPPGPNEYGVCSAGRCEYECVEGAADCDGICTFTSSDPANCGACGYACGDAAPYCTDGFCEPCAPSLTLCDGTCVSLAYNNQNCGACGNACGGETPYCVQGTCVDCVGAGGAICGGVCIDVMWDGLNCGGCGNVCPPQSACAWGVCYGICIDCY